MTEYAYWERRRADIVAGVPQTEMSTDEYNQPQSGWYRVKRKGRFVPVTWWGEGGEQICLLDFAPITDIDQIEKLWQFGCQRAVSEEDYLHYYEFNRWPDESAAVIGDNRAPDDDSIEAMRARYEDLAQEAERLIAEYSTGAPNADVAAQASDLAGRLGKVEKKASDLHDAEKLPILKTGREIDQKWFAVRDGAASLKTRLKHILLTPWLKAEKEADKPSITGTIEKRVSLRTARSAKIVDRYVLLEHLKDHDMVLKCIQNIADGAARNKVALPGVEIIEEARAV
jgi:hypothetical protein